MRCGCVSLIYWNFTDSMLKVYILFAFIWLNKVLMDFLIQFLCIYWGSKISLLMTFSNNNNIDTMICQAIMLFSISVIKA